METQIARDLLIQVVFLVIPLLTHQVLLSRKDGLRHSARFFLFTASSGISAILCISYPVVAEPGVIVDMRLIPWLFAFLYGGFWEGLAVTGIIVLYRLSLGGTGAVIFPLMLVSALPMLFVLVRTYPAYKPRKRLFVATGLALFLTIQILFFLDALLHVPFARDPIFILYYAALCAFSILLVVAASEFFLEKQRLHEEMARLERLEAMTQVAVSVAHEIKNPLTSVQGFLQLLSRRKSLTPEQTNCYLELALKEIQDAVRVIDDYLKLAGQRPSLDTKYDWLPLSEEIEQTLPVLSSLADRQGLSLSWSSSPDEIHVHCDRERLRNILIHLFHNVIMSLAAIDAGRGEISMKVFKERGEAVISITLLPDRQPSGDHAAAMNHPESHRKTGKTEICSDDLTINICRHMIETMRGRLVVEENGIKKRTILLKFPTAAAPVLPAPEVQK